MVPIETIDSLWGDILIDKPELPMVDEFLDYFTNTYFEGQFPVEFWNNFKTVGPRTNNHLEGYNLKLKKSVSVAHPNIYTAIHLFLSQEVSASLNYYRAANGEWISPRKKKEIEKDGKISNLKKIFDDGDISLTVYVKNIISILYIDAGKKQATESDADSDDDVFSEEDDDDTESQSETESEAELETESETESEVMTIVNQTIVAESKKEK